MRTLVLAVLGAQLVYLAIMAVTRDTSAGAAGGGGFPNVLRGRGVDPRAAQLLTGGGAACSAPPPEYDDAVLVGGQWTPTPLASETAASLQGHLDNGLGAFKRQARSMLVASYAPPAGSCVRWRTAAQARAFLRGKHLLFIGDSVSRSA